jgi:hypothetical protein
MHTVLVENQEEKRPSGGHRRMWKNNIKMCLKETG